MLHSKCNASYLAGMQRGHSFWSSVSQYQREGISVLSATIQISLASSQKKPGQGQSQYCMRMIAPALQGWPKRQYQTSAGNVSRPTITLTSPTTSLLSIFSFSKSMQGKNLKEWYHRSEWPTKFGSRRKMSSMPLKSIICILSNKICYKIMARLSLPEIYNGPITESDETF